MQERFFDHLGPEEIAVLSEVFSRFAPRAAAACDANARDAGLNRPRRAG